MIAAVFAPVAAVLAALAIDTGAIAHKQRHMQGLADLAAMTAARDIDNAEHSAHIILAVNGFAGAGTSDIESGSLSAELDSTYDTRVKVETGAYEASRDHDFARRFVVGAEPANAVRVTLSDEEPKYFSVLLGRQAAIKVSGTAAASSEVAYSVGSRLVSLKDGLANQILSALTGTEVSLTAMDYRGLMRADVDLFDALEAVSGDIGVEALTYDDVLDADVTLGDLFSAMAESSDNTSGASATLRSLAGERSFAALTVPLSALIDLGSIAEAKLGTPAPGLDMQVSAMQMLMAAAALSDGDHQVALDIDHDLDGLGHVEVTLEIGERPQSSPWFSVSRERQGVVSTAQARLFLDIRVEGLGLLHRDLVHLPLYLELAPAEAEVSSVVCESGNAQPKRVDLAVRPGIARLHIADLDEGFSGPGQAQDFKPAEILSTRLVSVRAEARSSLSSSRAETLRFYQAAIGNGEPLTAQTEDALSNALQSAMRNLHLEVELAGFSLISPDVVEQLIGHILAGAVEPVDTLVMDISRALGLSIGEADVWVHDARCNQSVLVQ